MMQAPQDGWETTRGEGFEIRRLDLEDYDALLALWRRCGLTSLRPQGRDGRGEVARQLASGVATLLGMEDREGELVGAVLATHDSRKGWINRLVVDPRHRRHGHARRLLDAAEGALRDQGTRVISALVESWNQPSLALFRQAGYTQGTEVLYLSKRENRES